MTEVLEGAVLEDVRQEALVPAELLPGGTEQPVNIVDGRPELILPSDHMSFTRCADQCFQELARTRRFFRQGSIIVELVDYSEGPKLVELSVEAFRSRLESHFTLRSVVIVNRQEALRPKLCPQDNGKALLV